ncbi:SelB C-terminal domain-containing protein [Pseudonocardia alni]|uniref:SelB domain-containing protein n=1 Tax=Pseudonocardia alni TaxID=33907 RepID=UPI00386C5D36
MEAVLSAVGGAGLVLRDGRVRAAADTGPPAALRDAAARVRADLDGAPFAAPGAARLAELGLGPRELAVLDRAGELLRVAPEVVLGPDAPERAVAALDGLDGAFTVSAAREVLGSSRRVVVPLLELLARRGLTVRMPDGTHRLR